MPPKGKKAPKKAAKAKKEKDAKEVVSSYIYDTTTVLVGRIFHQIHTTITPR
jgi:hypothetical protein